MAKAKTKFATTSQIFGKGHQDVVLTELLNYGDKRIRISIRSDSYKFQCYARLECFDSAAMKWNVVVYRPHADMQTPEKLVYHTMGEVQYQVQFSADRNWLMKQFQNLVD
jgi:hypothetical protein